MPEWFRKHWAEIRPNVKWDIVKWAIVLGSGLMTAGTITAIFQWWNQPIANITVAVIFVVSCILLAVGMFAHNRKQVETSENTVGRMMSIVLIYSPIVLGLVFCIWAYVVGKRVFQMSDDLELIRARMARYVLPRSLTPEQKKTIAEYLSKYEPQPIVMKVTPRNEEAGSYRADLQQALEKGGWPVASIDYDDTVPEGLQIHMSEPMREPGQESPFDRLNPKKKPTDILREAFDRAGVIVNGTGGGSGRNITAVTITISIGHRRRDKWAIPPPPRQRGGLPEDPDNRD